MRIAISGAGIAGATLAHWLMRSGHETTLIEKAPHFRTGGYMIDFWGTGYDVAERMQILPRIRQLGYAVQEVRLVDERGRRSGGFLADVFRRMTHERFTSLPRGELASAIFESVRDGTETLFDNSIAAIEQDDRSVQVRFMQGAPREFDLLIGADGLHSNVRELVFGGDGRFERQLGYCIAAFEIEGYRPRDEGTYVAYAVPGRQVARFSLRDDLTMFLFIAALEHPLGSEPRDGAERKAWLERAFGDCGWECPQILEAMSRKEDVYFDRVSQIRIDAWSRGRTALVGDAAACVSLLAGEGAGLAMTEAYVLAGELQRWPGDYRKAFRSYEEKLRPFVEGKQESARKFASAFVPRTHLGIWFRNWVTRLMFIPAVADYFVGRDLRDDFELPSYEM